jgi:hypothetical protein
MCGHQDFRFGWNPFGIMGRLTSLAGNWMVRRWLTKTLSILEVEGTGRTVSSSA